MCSPARAVVPFGTACLHKIWLCSRCIWHMLFGVRNSLNPAKHACAARARVGRVGLGIICSSQLLVHAGMHAQLRGAQMEHFDFARVSAASAVLATTPA
jgi:hypothetical protein